MAKVVLVGSSIFQQWQSAPDAFPGRTVVNRAIGGTTTAHWLGLLDTVLNEEQPDALCVYCGSNDLNAAVEEAQIVDNSLRVRQILHDFDEKIPCAWFGIISAPQKLGKWDQIERINRRIGSDLHEADRYVELNSIFFEGDVVRTELFVEDQLHLTQQAYALMVDAARTALDDWQTQAADS